MGANTDLHQNQNKNFRKKYKNSSLYGLLLLALSNEV